jgi:hypothetical protein
VARIVPRLANDVWQGPTTFKWSRDNGSIVTAVKSITGATLTVSDLGRDEVLGFTAGQWVELIDEVSELNGSSGSLSQIDGVSDSGAAPTITLKELPTVRDGAKRLKLRRWDQSGDTASSDRVMITAHFQPLENGISVGPNGRIGDYWALFSTRSEWRG